MICLKILEVTNNIMIIFYTARSILEGNTSKAIKISRMAVFIELNTAWCARKGHLHNAQK